MTAKPSKDDAAKLLITWHFDIEPEMTEIYRFVSSNEEDPEEPIRLLEVNEVTVPTGNVEVFGFRPSADVPFWTHVAEITPHELERIRSGQIPLPNGWDLQRAQRYRRPENG